MQIKPLGRPRDDGFYVDSSSHDTNSEDEEAGRPCTGLSGPGDIYKKKKKKKKKNEKKMKKKSLNCRSRLEPVTVAVAVAVAIIMAETREPAAGTVTASLLSPGRMVHEWEPAYAAYTVGGFSRPRITRIDRPDVLPGWFGIIWRLASKPDPMELQGQVPNPSCTHRGDLEEVWKRANLRGPGTGPSCAPRGLQREGFKGSSGS
ncbi:uncharacterized protein UV8b_03274 [Ustilaginoidea virens]|uniref:Uncharacterized protein n=1 Tax=Ustilaginoidea virens TaxID=1159556 RepID=A0A8E5HPF8_USTVR|nr:uncharacterized protein UV8b_03274 [Ustilaginoidea virens]QUC19033.1 hypothetical protein UV8b_03274 [Ustilaginoidea virens]